MEIVIIGGIAAGMSVAAKAKRENPSATITVIEKENYISFGACGLPYYLGAQFTDSNMMFARKAEEMRELGINILLEHETIDINFDVRIITVKDLRHNRIINQSYDRLMIATGAKPILPDIQGINAKNVYTFTKLADADHLKSHLQSYKTIAIIGGGFIGIEVAEQLKPLTDRIKLIQASNHLINRPFDPEFSTKIKTVLEKSGVDVLLNTQLINFKISDDNQVTHVITAKESLAVDAVIIAIGFKPNTNFISDNRLKKLNNGAIIINQFGETSILNVFSAGDCATVPHKFLGDIYLPLATSANKLGRIIGSNIVSDLTQMESYGGSLGSCSIKIANYEAGSTGLTEKSANALNIPYKTTTVQTNSHAGYYPNPKPIDIKLIYHSESRVLLGAQVFGEESAVLRMTALSTAIYAELRVDEIAQLDYAYAPPFATTWDAINIAANSAK